MRRSVYCSGLFAIGVSLTAASAVLADPIVYVGASGPPHDGSSWCKAYTALEDALAHADASGGVVTEIWVAAGTYRPSGQTDPDDPRSATFQLISGVTIEGGYAGCGAPDPDERDIELYETILSGDLDSDDDPLDFPGGTSFSENSYHVVTASNTDATAVLDGFTITAGNADRYHYNDTLRGAGLYIGAGSPTISNCRIESNVASSVYDGLDAGGGAYVSTGAPTFSDSSFTGNIAGTSGGGVYVKDGSLTLIRCNFDQNIASKENGGAVYASGSSATLVDCDFTGNEADDDGGGMYHTGEGSEATATLSGCSFSSNTAYNGGGLALEDQAVATLTDCSFADNEAAGGGGGLWLHNGSDVTVNAPCTVSGNTAVYGGAVALQNGSTAALSACAIQDNQAMSAGGAIWLSVGSSGEITGCTIHGNRALGVGGGAIYLERLSDVTVNGGELTQNIASGPSSIGGAIASFKHDQLPVEIGLQDCVVSGNFASNGGGAVYAQKADTLGVSGCTIEDNGTDGDNVTLNGGGIYCGGYEDRAHIVTNSKIRNNKAENAGGGIFVAHAELWTSVTIEDCVIEGNRAIADGIGYGDGGGIYAGAIPGINPHYTYVRMSRSKIVANQAAGYGGGMFVYGIAEALPFHTTVTDTLVAQNLAGVDGGGIYHWAGSAELRNCTIVDNEATGNGGGFAKGVDTTTIQNSIFWGNTGSSGPQIYNGGDDGGDLTISYSDVEGGEAAIAGGGTVVWDSETNRDADPLFIDPTGTDEDLDNDYMLDPEAPSPCIDAGDNSVIGHLAVDLAGKPRIVCVVDMGAYETQEDVPGWEDPGDPGLVVVVGEARGLLKFEVEVYSQYEFSYGPGRISLWKSLTGVSPFDPDTPYDAQGPEAGCKLDLLGFLALQRCFTAEGGGPVDPDCAEFDSESDDDVDLADFATFHPVGSGPVCNTVSVYVEAVNQSEELGDAAVTLQVQPEGETEFYDQATQLVTAALVGISPESGGIGTPLTITLDPAIPPLAFNAATTAGWVGRYNPVIGEDTEEFEISYDTVQFREDADEIGQAIVIVGDGAITNAPSIGELDGPGSVNGTFTFNLTELTLQRSHSLGLEVSGGTWEIAYRFYDGTGGAIAGEVPELRVMQLSNTSDPLNPSEELLYGADSFHVAAVVRVEGTDDPQNPCDDTPGTICVDLVSFDPGGAELDRVADLTLNRVIGDDGDPTHFVYHNDLTKPIVLVDVDLDEGTYFNFVPFRLVPGGSAVIVASTGE